MVAIKASKKLIEPATELFKGDLRDVLPSKAILLQDHCEEPGFARMQFDDSFAESILDCTDAVFARNSPPLLNTFQHRGAM